MLKAFVRLPTAVVNRASSAKNLGNVSDKMKVNGAGNEGWVTTGAEKKLPCLLAFYYVDLPMNNPIQCYPIFDSAQLFSPCTPRSVASA